MKLPRCTQLRFINSRRNKPALSRISAVYPLAAILVAMIVVSTGLRAAEATAAQPLERWEAACRIYRAEGKTADVITLLQNMREELRRTDKAETEAYSQITFYLGVYLRDVCDFGGAKAALAEAAELAGRLHGTNSRQYLSVLNHQADLLVKQHRYTEAEIMGRDVLQRVETTMGPDAPLTADVLQTLTLALLELKKYDESKTNLNRILGIRLETERHGWATGVAFNNLGTYYLETGQIQEAGKALTLGAKFSLAAIRGELLGSRLIFRNLVRLQLDRADAAMASRAANLLFDQECRIVQDVFPSLAEPVRLELIGKLEPVRWFATMGDAERIATAILQTKAVTLDQLVAESGVNASGADPFTDLLKPECAAQGLVPCPPDQAAWRLPASPFAPRVIRKEGVLKGQALFTASPYDAMEQALLPRKPLYAITPEQVCRMLPSGTAVIEFVRYNHYVGRYKDEPRYGALVFRSRQSVGEDLSDQLAWVPLGASEAIDREIDALQSNIRDPLAAGLIATRLRTLYGLVWAPVAQALPAGTENVFVCPDGQTCFLPFGALLDSEGRFLADKQFVMYLSTTRDLLRLGEEKTVSNQDFAVFAAPNYGQVASSGTAPESRFRDVDARSLSGLQLTDLPGSRAEAQMLKTLAAQRHFQPGLFLGAAANKENAEAMHQPRVVHFATHGFFLPPAADGSPGNPMDRSGLALAGAQATLKAMAEGRVVPAAANDGILTAREVARLPLSGTWLATLSACDTGRGEARDGEGVLGLRRGFLAAGVQNLMISLWNISDHETVAFMRDFYSRALESSDPAMALALTQREWLARLRKERGIAAAVSTAGAFVLNTSGRLPIAAVNP